MAIEFDFTNPGDRPALIAFSNPSYLAIARPVLKDLGFNVHEAANHQDFMVRYSQRPYELVMIEQLFASEKPEENISLEYVQELPMTQRRDTVFVLLGESFESMDTLAAFVLSVHAVINAQDMPNLAQVVQQALADNSMVLSTLRETSSRIAAGKV
jgi:hypothetical protein